MEEVKVDLSGEMNVPQTENKSPFDMASISMFKKIPTPMELVQMIRKSVRPWSEFINTSNYKAAVSFPRLSTRFLRNLSYFQSNYIIIFIILMIYCLITSPLILIVLAAVAYISHRLKKIEAPITMFGYQFGTNQQILAAHIAAVPVLFLVGAGSALFWTLGASCFVISLHAVFYNIDAIVTEETEGFLSEVV